MSIYPKQYKKKYDIPGLHITPNSNTNPRGTGSDVSDRGHILYIGSAPLERVIGFKAFLESFKINLQKEKEIISPANQNNSYIKEKEGSLSYDLTLNLPAHSTNEAINNMAKIEELQRLIAVGADWRITTEEKFDDVTAEFIVKSEYEGVSSLSETTLPLFYVFFKNLINSGNYFSSDKISSFEDLVAKGFTCYIDNVDYSPDVEAGYFEFDNFFYPKNIKLVLKLNYDSENLFIDKAGSLLNRRIIMPYSVNGLRNTLDTGLFPFHSSFIDSDYFNNISSKDHRNLTRKNYIFIGKKFGSLVNEYETEVDNTLDVNPTQRLETGFGEAFTDRYVVFDLFLESFNRDLKYKNTLKKAGSSSIFSKVIDGGTRFESLNYSVKINVVSENLLEAKKNAKKMQVLMRLFYKLFYDGTTPLNNDGNISKEDRLQKLSVYIPSMIEKPKAQRAMATTAEQMFENGVHLFLEDLSFDIDMDQGFFEEGSKMFAKSFSIDLKLYYNKNDLIVNYSMGKEGEERYYYFKKPTGGTGVSSENAHLFPYNRKTVRIGKPIQSSQSVPVDWSKWDE